MRGFLSESMIKPLTRGPQAQQVGCGSCGLFRGCRSPKIGIGGKGRAGILCLGEAPGEAGDAEGEAWAGEAGAFLEEKLRPYGIHLSRDCWCLEAVQCRPPKDRAPKASEIMACRPRVWQTIRELKPKLILLFGATAVASFLGDRWRKDALGGIPRWRGWTIPDREARAWACPLLPPNEVLKQRKAKGGKLGVEAVFDRDLAQALGKLDEPFPYTDIFREEEFVRIIQNEDELNRHLVYLLCRFNEHPEDLLAIDLETTGLKPYRDGHRIVSCALAYGMDEVIAFPWPTGNPPQSRLRRLLGDPRIRKVAANLPFEDRWLTHFGFPVEGWCWDTLLAAHVLDNRTGVTGLKFQTYVQFGVLGYDDDVGPWLRSGGEEEAQHGANAFNRIEELWRKKPEELLRYNGMDALLEYRLARKQMVEVGKR